MHFNFLSSVQIQSFSESLEGARSHGMLKSQIKFPENTMGYITIIIIAHGQKQAQK